MICGGTMFGNCANGKPSNETMPTSTVTMAMTIATIGRRMKKAAISVTRVRARRSRGYERFSADLGPRRELPGVDNHAVARLDALVDDPPRSDPFPERDGFDLDGVVRRDDAHLRCPLEVGHRALR